MAATRTPTDEPRLVRVAAAIADASRARMLSHLLDGHSATAGELAAAASVGAATASGHLAKLVEHGLVEADQRGRHRYFRLADAEVAHALEALALVAERGARDRAWASPARQRLREARCCYGHLAGRLGVALCDCATRRGWLSAATDGYALTGDGAAQLDRWGMDGAGWLQRSQRLQRHRRCAYPCMDWSERRDHMAGPLAKAMLDHFVAQDWLRRSDGERALAVTPPGRKALAVVMDDMPN